MARVGFDHVTKRFDGTVAVDDLSLEIAEGELLVLVGPSGCGKSTALRMLAGLEDVTEGRILIGDRVVNNVRPASRDVAMVFQSYALYPHMTVYDNLAFGLRNFKVPKAEIDERVRNAAEILEMGDLLKRKPKQLSGGQRQRVALGRAIVREPVAFLMDEPLSNLDAALRVADAGRDHAAPGPARDDDDLRHARPGRGDDDGRPDRGHALGRAAAGRDARGALHAARERLRRAVHRLAGDEHRAGGARRRAGDVRAAASASGPSTSSSARRGGDGASFEADVEVVEYLGDEQLVHLRLGDEPVLAKLDVDQRARQRRPARRSGCRGRPAAPVRRRDRAGAAG